MSNGILLVVVAHLAWAVGVLVVFGGAAVGLLAPRLPRPWLGLGVLVPVVLGTIVLGIGGAPAAPLPLWRFALDAGWVALAVTGGAPLVRFVLDRAPSVGVREGVAGGIVVDSGDATDATEVLRGGGTIGYLERFAIAAAIGLGRLEVLAGIIALKGLGRFGELGESAARERFIIGTLVSIIWASWCGALILFG